MIKINQVTLIGRICNVIELRYTISQSEVVTLNMAIQRDRKSQEGEYQTDFINAIAYNNNANLIAKYCEKGDKIAIEGALRTSAYENQRGEKRTNYTVVINRVEFIERKKNKDAILSSTNTEQKESVGTNLKEQQEEMKFTDEEGMNLPF